MLQADRLDHDANQGKVSGHADHGAYQNSNQPLPDPPLKGRESHPRKKAPLPIWEGAGGKVSGHADHVTYHGEIPHTRRYNAQKIEVIFLNLQLF